MFKFDFRVEEIEEENPFVGRICTVDQTKNNSSFPVDSLIHWHDSEEIFVSKEIIENLDVCKLNSMYKDIGGVKICHIISGFILEEIKGNNNCDLAIKQAEEQHSDLIPGVYEGGAKIWDCTEDLLMYLSQNVPVDKWKKARVLDLGCGSGLLGIYGFLNEAKVTFQDYNKDVLEKITIPNVLLNTSVAFEDVLLNTSVAFEDGSDKVYGAEKLKVDAQFFSGDWEKWSKLTQNENFDIILTSETIYNPLNHQKLINCLYDKLKSNGTVFVAAKAYYFGVGGDLQQFKKLIEKDERFKYKTVWLSTEGVNREIIELIKNI